MENMSSTTRNAFSVDLSAVDETMRSAIDPGYAAKKEKHWEVWMEYCQSINIDPFLLDVDDPIEIIQVFGHQYRDGLIAPAGTPSNLAQFLTHSARWARGSPAWGPLTHASIASGKSISESNDNYEVTRKRTDQNDA